MLLPGVAALDAAARELPRLGGVGVERAAGGAAARLQQLLVSTSPLRADNNRLLLRADNRLLYGGCNSLHSLCSAPPRIPYLSFFFVSLYMQMKRAPRWHALGRAAGSESSVRWVDLAFDNVLSASLFQQGKSSSLIVVPFQLWPSLTLQFGDEVLDGEELLSGSDSYLQCTCSAHLTR